MPQTAAAGAMARRAGKPPITSVRYAGTNKDTGAQMRPTLAESGPRGNPVTVDSMIRGVPMEPNATGDVFASRQRLAAKNGRNPRPVSIAAATATGVPNPAAPSMNAPNAKAISNA